MDKLRHIALSVDDPEAAAQFFERAFGMHRAGNAMRGIYMTDGTINVALLNFKDETVPGYAGLKDVRGVIHFGMWVDDVDATAERVVAAGGTYLTGRHEQDPNVFYEVKYRMPDGTVFDITSNGWKGAVKEVVPAGAAGTQS
ncbi:MAG: VOC family protein [Burkholderia sp.]|jgi:methylmalonyl-CoA/ethylmalonyl-CoA epimerase|uniref:VOC family protein n=2 Tax=Burkholderiaceae TaxID=119060 RepID=UPI00158C8062|nr:MULTISPECIES: VOC family protein [Burkholderia]MBY8609732.1 VOC family protein [Burkholderia arboris]MCA3782078.1 VOC family protein [Burkholderia sp.]MCA3788626.1 VOC family protein [Burkholderia sp.]MCA3793261.1 VOC family protein [Burkholderia sp.]MCA3812972.1 VOC family protein [Burkholderia sp.]